MTEETSHNSSEVVAIEESHSTTYKELLAALDKLKEPEKKLELAITRMREAISQTGTPRFKEFWDAKKICQDLFKEKMNPIVRAHLWTAYIQLSDEAKSLKKIFDEQSTFAVEQIELAISAIEKDLSEIDELVKKIPPFRFSTIPPAMVDSANSYVPMQHELNLLHVYAVKIQALRKELIKTDMRMRDKNGFFARLSKLGDQIFPRRKLLIDAISTQFTEDVNAFMKRFANQKMSKALDLRQEIKSLQAVTKEISLSKEVYEKTRELFGQAWEELKTAQVEQKKRSEEEDTASHHQRDQFLQDIQAIRQKCENKTFNEERAMEALTQLTHRLKKAKLTKSDLTVVRDNVSTMRDYFTEVFHPELLRVKEDLVEREKKRTESIQQIQQQIESLLQSNDDVELLVQNMQAIEKVLEKSAFMRQEKAILLKKLAELAEHIDKKREEKRKPTTKDSQERLEQLKLLLRERKARRQAIKDRLESLKRATAGSGLGFLEALTSGQEEAEELTRLEKIEESIANLREEIAELEGK